MDQEDGYEKADMEAQESKPQQQDKMGWIAYSFGATMFFSLTNSAMAEVSEKAGQMALPYYASGFIFASIIYHIYDSRKSGKCWNDQNIVKYNEDNKL